MCRKKGVNTLKTNEQTLRSYGFRPFSEDKDTHAFFAGASADAFFLETTEGYVVVEDTGGEPGQFVVQAHRAHEDPGEEPTSFGVELSYGRLAVSVALAVGSLLRSGKSSDGLWQDVLDWLEEL